MENHNAFARMKVDVETVFSALGDPLIKGLTEVANVKPKDPIAFLASFLHNFPDHEKLQLGTQVIVQHSADICTFYIVVCSLWKVTGLIE